MPVPSACQSDPSRAARHVAAGGDDPQGEHDSVHAQVENVTFYLLRIWFLSQF